MLGLVACAGTTSGTAVAVTDIATVAGKWSGLLEMTGSRVQDDFVELTVDGSGRYQARAARTRDHPFGQVNFLPRPGGVRGKAPRTARPPRAPDL